MGIDKRELKIIIALGLFAVVWGILATPFLQNSVWFNSLPPIIAYPIYNFAFIVFFGVFVGGMLTLLLKKRQAAPINFIVNGFSTWLLAEGFFDMLQPPFLVSPDGCVGVFGSQGLVNVSVDVFWHNILSSVFGQACNPLYSTIIYGIVPIGSVIFFATVSYLQLKDIF